MNMMNRLVVTIYGEVCIVHVCIETRPLVLVDPRIMYAWR